MHASGAAIEGVLVFDMNPCKRTGTVRPIRRMGKGLCMEVTIGVVYAMLMAGLRSIDACVRHL